MQISFTTKEVQLGIRIAILALVTMGVQLAQASANDRPRFVEPTPEKALNPAAIRNETVDLQGAWRFGLNDDPSRSHLQKQVRAAALDMEIQVPFAPQSRASGLGLKDLKADVVWYEREITLPSDWRGGLLHFEGVDAESQVFFNGKLVGEHRGGFDPFAIDVSRALRFGTPTRNGEVRHKITVRAKDSRTSRTQIVGKQERIENEGVIFYGNSIGIWKPVYLERVEDTYLKDLRIDADSSGRLKLTSDVVGQASGKARIQLRLENGAPAVIDEEVNYTNGKLAFETKLEQPKLWSTDSPSLYFADVQLQSPDGQIKDTVKTYTGFRSFEMKDGYFRENGRPFQLRGLLNQAIYPETLYTPTEADTLRDFSYTKAAGFNGERRHQTTPTKRDQWNADRMGLWMAIELPSARDLTRKDASEEALRQWKEIVKAYAFHPSVYFLVPGNEDWGFLRDKDHRTRASATDREKFQIDSYHATDEVAPKGMLVSAGDGWRLVTPLKNGKPVSGIDPSRLMTNLHDYSYGARLIKKYGDLPVFTVPGTDLPTPSNLYPKPAIHENGYEYDGKVPLVLSEMGGRAFTKSTGNIFAYGGKVHRTPEAWMLSLGNILKSLKYIKVFRGGYVLTQTRDAGNDPKDPASGGELNGILTADGREKVPASQFSKLNEEIERAWMDGTQEYERLAREYETPEGRRRMENDLTESRRKAAEFAKSQVAKDIAKIEEDRAKNSLEANRAATTKNTKARRQQNNRSGPQTCQAIFSSY